MANSLYSMPDCVSSFSLNLLFMFQRSDISRVVCLCVSDPPQSLHNLAFGKTLFCHQPVFKTDNKNCHVVHFLLIFYLFLCIMYHLFLYSIEENFCFPNQINFCIIKITLSQVSYSLNVKIKRTQNRDNMFWNSLY